MSRNNHKEQQPTRSDSSDYSDDADDTSHDSFTERCYCSEGNSVYQEQESSIKCEDVKERQQGHSQQDPAVILRNQRHHCNHCHHRNHMYERTVAEDIQGASSDSEVTIARENQREAFLQRNRCPHHPHAHLVRFDAAGQAWCDKMDCWDCFRLMKIGEALEYRRLSDLGGKVVIEHGIAAWSHYVLSQRAFLIVVATEQAIVLCKALDIEVPDVSGEVKRLVEVHPAPS